MNLSDIDRTIIAAMQGLDGFAATHHASADAEPRPCHVLRDTLEIPNEYGVPTIQSGAVVQYLLADLPAVRKGSWFEFDGRRYIVENLVPTQDSSWRQAHCRVEVISD